MPCRKSFMLRTTQVSVGGWERVEVMGVKSIPSVCDLDRAGILGVEKVRANDQVALGFEAEYSSSCSSTQITEHSTAEIPHSSSRKERSREEVE